MKYYDNAGKWRQTTTATVPANGAVRISTPESDRWGSSDAWWATVTSTQPAGVNLFIELNQGGESQKVGTTVGFNDAPPGTSFTIPVEFEPNPDPTVHPIGRTVGLAVANPAAGTAANVTLKLVNAGGTVVATYNLQLAPLSQTAIALDSLDAFKFALPAGNFVGVVTISADSPVSTIALGDDLGPFFSTPAMAGRAR